MILATGKTLERKKVNKLCHVVGCGCKAAIRSDTKRPIKFCNKHDHQNKKDRNPLKYWYGQLRRNAKRRRKIFTITLDDFKKFCDETGYLELKGRGKYNMTIDRRIDELGYIPGNLVMITCSSNVRKKYTDYWKHRTDEEENYQPTGEIITFGQEPLKDLPF